MGLGESKFCALALEEGAWWGLLDGDEPCLWGPEELGGQLPLCPALSPSRRKPGSGRNDVLEELGQRGRGGNGAQGTHEPKVMPWVSSSGC